jgi:ABC-type nitrate/sulfonate/bicarbonate transport system permease component
MGFIVPMFVLASWEALSRAGVLSEDGFSRPSRWSVALGRALLDGTLLTQTAQTFAAAAQALFIASLIGIALGAVLGLFRPLERVAQLTIDALRPIPSVALIPVSLLVFGFSREMSAAVAAFACFWPILLVTTASVRNVDPRLIEVGRMLGFALPKIILKFAIPAALPGIWVGIRVAAAIGIVVTVTTEIVTNPRGLGHAMTMAAQALQPELVWATLIWVGMVGWAVNWLLERVGQR